MSGLETAAADPRADDRAASAPTHPSKAGWSRTGWLAAFVAKNVFVFGALIGSYYAYETGYFSNDRTSRFESNELDRLKIKNKPRLVYEANFSRDVVTAGPTPNGTWGFYNGATKDTVAVADNALVLNYTSAWIGSVFRHTTYEANAAYRLTIEAKVETEPAAVLMRNRQLDLMREVIPVSDGVFQTYTFHYVAPNGRYDQVNLIFMPDGRGKVQGRMTVRKFRIERLED